MTKLEVELNWTSKKLFYQIMIKFYESLREKPSKSDSFRIEHKELFEKKFIFYRFNLKDKLLYLGRTSPQKQIYDRILNEFHDGLRKIMLFYPNPKEVQISCAIISMLNVEQTDLVLNDIENTLIFEAQPEFNIFAKESYDNKFDEYTIRNTGDYFPLKHFYAWKDK